MLFSLDPNLGLKATPFHLLLPETVEWLMLLTQVQQMVTLMELSLVLQEMKESPRLLLMYQVRVRIDAEFQNLEIKIESKF